MAGPVGARSEVAVELRVLGPLALIGPNGPVELRGEKRRGLVAYLAVHRGQALALERLVEDLWDGRPTPGAPRTVRTYVSQLRKVLGDVGGGAQIVTRGSGYSLEVDSGSVVDVDRFEQLCREASGTDDAEGRVARLDEALALWRGPALGEFAGIRWADAGATRLESLRLDACHHRIEALAALGRDTEAISELERLVAEHPLDERFWAQLLVAYYRSGRQSDALRAYRELRSRLTEELGIDPGPELQDLERRLLDQDETLLAPRDKGRVPALPEGILTFLLTDIEGSTALWDTAASAMADALARHERIVGEAVALHGGILVKPRGEGDSTLSVFTQATAAVAAALALQRVLVAEEWTGGLELGTRVGLHTGEVQLRDGDYYGGTLNRAARIRALTAGGQILCSRATADLVADTLPEAVELVALGTHALQGLRRSESIYALVHPDLPDTGPRALPGSAVLSLEVPLPARLASSAAPFVGREREVAALQAAFETARADGGRRVVLIGGEPGIGKTTLAAHVARAAYDDGAVVLYGRCDDDLSIPFQPWTQVLGHLVRHAPDGLVGAHLSARGGPLTALVPGLMERGAPPVAPSRDPEADRYLLYGAVLDLLERVAAIAPVVLVLDDLHWADRSSVQLLRHVANAELSLRLLIVGTYRDSDLADEDPFAVALAALHREPGVERIGLGGLDTGPLGTLLELAAGHALAPDDLALRDALAAETDGNPFFVTELLRHLAETGMISRNDDGRWIATSALTPLSLPTSVRDVIAQRVARLGDVPRRVLGLAAVIGRDFEVDVLREVSELDEATVLDVLDAATGAALVQPAAGEADRYTFVHALIEHTLCDALSPARRRRTHTRIAGALEARVGTDPGYRVGELAHHWLEAGDDLQKALDYCTRAGDHALKRLAAADALTWFRRALVLADQASDETERRARVLCGLGVAQRDVGEAGFRETLLDAARLAEGLDATELLARAALANTRGLFSAVGEIDADRVGVLEVAVTRAPDATTKARLLALLAGEHTFDRDFARRCSLAEEAVELARHSGDTRAVVEVLNNVYFAMWAPQTHRRRLELTGDAIDLVETFDDPVLTYWAHVRRAFALIEDCDLAGYDRHESAFVALADRIGQPALLWYAQVVHGTRLLLGGHPDQAEGAADEHLELGTALGQPDAMVFYGSQLGFLRFMQGRGDELVAGVDVADTLARALPTPFRAALAVVHCELGREQDARAIVEELVADDFARVPPGHNWLGTLIDLARAAARCEMTQCARTLIERLRPYAGLLAYVPSAVRGAVDLQLGALARTLGSYDEALEHLDRAAELHARLQAPYYIALTDLERARTLRARGAPGDGTRARELLADVRQVAEERGFAGLRGEAAEMQVER